MLCIKCGNKIPDGSSFCNRCGNPVVAEPVVIPEPLEMVLETPVILPEAPQPENPVSQETVILPQVSGDSTMEQPPLNQATIVVPEIPDTAMNANDDSLEEMYPEQEEKSNTGLIIGLVVAGVLLLITIIVVILGMMNNWWRNDSKDDSDSSAITSSTETTDSTKPVDPEDPDEKLTAEQLRQTLTEFETYGLYLYLNDGFEEVERGDDGAVFESADLDLLVFWSSVTDSSALSYAQSYETLQKDNFERIERSLLYGTPYTVAYQGNKVTLTGFYVKGGYGWMVQIVTREFEARKDELINYVTLAQVDPTFEPPVSEQNQTQEFVFLGLGLTMDSTLTAVDNDDYCIYKNDNIMVVVQFTETPSALTSKEYAEAVLNDNQESDWTQIYMDTMDDVFYYVAMADDMGMVTLKGMYVYEGVGWIVDIDTQEGEKYALAMMEYITSGRIIPEEVPKKNLQVEFNELGLTLPGTFSEQLRNEEYLHLSDGDLDVYIECVTDMDMPANAEAMAQQQYNAHKALWDNVELGSMMNTPYVVCWNDNRSVVMGQYLVDDTWWVVRVEANHTSRMTEMKTIAASGITPEPAEKPFQRGETVKRDRITLSGQLTADYEGLLVSYSPDWVPDLFSGGAGDFKSADGVTMFSYKAALEFYDSSSALDVIWREAEFNCDMWDHYEVGIAGGVPYLYLWDDSGLGQVIGAYDDGINCWTITITFDNAAFENEAVWYATAGVIL